MNKSHSFDTGKLKQLLIPEASPLFRKKGNLIKTSVSRSSSIDCFAFPMLTGSVRYNNPLCSLLDSDLFIQRRDISLGRIVREEKVRDWFVEIKRKRENSPSRLWTCPRQIFSVMDHFQGLFFSPWKLHGLSPWQEASGWIDNWAVPRLPLMCWQEEELIIRSKRELCFKFAGKEVSTHLLSRYWLFRTFHFVSLRRTPRSVRMQVFDSVIDTCVRLEVLLPRFSQLKDPVVYGIHRFDVFIVNCIP